MAGATTLFTYRPWLSPVWVGSFVLVLITGLITAASPLIAGEATDPALDVYFAANASYNRKLYPIATVQYQDFLRRHGDHPKAPQARYGLALSYCALKQFDKALPELQKLVEAKQLDDAIDRGHVTLLLAQCLINTGKGDQALGYLKEAAKSLPAGGKRAGVIAAVVDLYFATGDWQQTLEWAGKLEAAGPTSEQAIRAGYQKGMALERLDRANEAIKVLEKSRAQAVASDSKGWTTRIDQLLGSCYLAEGNLPKAEAAFQAAFAGLEGEQAVELLWQLAAIKYQQGQWAAAQADYESYVARKGKTGNPDPRLREAKFLAALCLMEQGSNPQADRALSLLSDQDDAVAARSLLWRGRILTRDAARASRYDDAAKLLASAKEKPWYKSGFPSEADGQAFTIVADIDYELANALMLQSSPNWGEAISLFGRVEQLQPAYRHMPEVLSQRAICEHMIGKYDQSLKSAGRFLERYPDNPLAADVRFHRAENLFMLGKHDEALEAYREFLEKAGAHKDRLAAEFRIAQIHHLAGRWEESNKLAAPLLAKAPEGKLFARLSFLVGDSYFRQGRWAEAIDPLEAFVGRAILKAGRRRKVATVNPGTNVDDALAELGVAYTHVANRDMAISRLELLVRGYGDTSPHYPLALVELGKLYFQADDLTHARETLTAFIDGFNDPGNKAFRTPAAAAEIGRAYYYLGWVESAEGKFAEAATAFGKASGTSAGGKKAKGLQGGPLEADAALQQGIALVNAKQYQEAADHLRNVAKRYPDHAHIGLLTYYTGLAYARVENWAQAGEFFRQVAELSPDAEFADKAVYEWAWCERALNRKEKAIEHYELLLAKYKESPLAIKVQSELAELNLDAGAQDAVIANLTEALAQAADPSLKFELSYQLANAYFQKRDYERAAPLFEALIEQGPPQVSKALAMVPSILFQAGEARLALTEAVRAREHFLAASQNPRATPALAESILLRLAEVQSMTGQYAEATANYIAFLKKYPRSEWQRNARYGLGFALEKQQEYGKAIVEYQQLLSPSAQAKGKGPKLDKWMVQARFQIGECHFNQQQYDKAIAEFVSVDANSPGYPDWQAKAVLEIGRVFLAQGKTVEGQDRMKEVIRRFPQTTAATVAQNYLDEVRSGSGS